MTFDLFGVLFYRTEHGWETDIATTAVKLLVVVGAIVVSKGEAVGLAPREAILSLVKPLANKYAACDGVKLLRLQTEPQGITNACQIVIIKSQSIGKLLAIFRNSHVVGIVPSIVHAKLSPIMHLFSHAELRKMKTAMNH